MCEQLAQRRYMTAEWTNRKTNTLANAPQTNNVLVLFLYLYATGTYVYKPSTKSVIYKKTKWNLDVPGNKNWRWIIPLKVSLTLLISMVLVVKELFQLIKL